MQAPQDYSVAVGLGQVKDFCGLRVFEWLLPPGLMNVTENWKLRVDGGEIVGRPAVLSDGDVVVGTLQGSVYRINPSSNGETLLHTLRHVASAVVLLLPACSLAILHTSVPFVVFD